MWPKRLYIEALHHLRTHRGSARQIIAGTAQLDSRCTIMTQLNKRALQKIQQELSEAKQVLRAERKRKKAGKKSGKHAKSNAKRALKVVEQGVELVGERRRVLREQLRRGA
jgi:hypothetical protein